MIYKHVVNLLYLPAFFWPSKERYSTKKIILMAIYVIDAQE